MSIHQSKKLLKTKISLGKKIFKNDIYIKCSLKPRSWLIQLCQDQDQLLVRSVTQCLRGQLTKWDCILPRPLGEETCGRCILNHGRLSFLIRTTYDTPPPVNGLTQKRVVACIEWPRENTVTSCVPTRPLCAGSLQVAAQPGAKEAGRCDRTWESWPTRSPSFTRSSFLQHDNQYRPAPHRAKPSFTAGNDWSMTADHRKGLKFQTVITTTSMSPGIILSLRN